MSFVAGVTSTNDQDVDLLFGETTPGAKDLIGAVKKDDPDGQKKEPIKKDPPVATMVEGEPVVEPVNHGADSDLLLGGEGDDKGVKAPAKTVAAPAKTVKDPEPAKLPEGAEPNYEAIFHEMVAQKLWRDVEIPEDFEWNKEGFLQIQKLQTTSQYEDLLDRTGTYGKAIIEFEQNGGNPKELLDLFRDQREVQEFDITDADSQELFLRSYLEAQGNSQKSIDRTIKALQEQGPDAFKEEAEEKKAIWDAQYKEEIEARNREQALYARQREDAQRKFNSTIESTLTSDSEVTPKERRELQNYILDLSQPFQGKQVSQFYVDMAEIQKDPKNYVELAKFIKGLKTGEYTKKVADKVKKETSAVSFLKIKNNATIKAPNTGAPDLTDRKASSFLDYLKTN